MVNTWVFTGGANVEGGFSHTRGVRNYVSQFENYIRWALPRHKTDATLPSIAVVAQMQRYVTNTAASGQTLHAIVKSFNDVIIPLGPKTVGYMVGTEDEAAGPKGISQFSKDLKKLITKATDLRFDDGFILLQTPPTRGGAADTNAALYAQAMRKVVATYKGTDAYNRIVFVDHYKATKKLPTFVRNDEDAQGNLNAAGHLVIARQLIAVLSKTAGVTDSFTADDIDIQRAEVPEPTIYLTKTAKVSATAHALTVTLPAGLTPNKWRYTLKINESTAPVVVGSDAEFSMSGSIHSAKFTIANVPRSHNSGGEDAWTLTLRSADGKRQLKTLYGKLGAAASTGTKDTSTVTTAKISPIAALKKKFAAGTPLTWLFMGDSITHGEEYTKGHDSISQTVDKYLKGVLGRTHDVVINTAVASTTTKQTLENINQRLRAYSPDVVSVMLGTNDSVVPSMTPARYTHNLTQIVADIRKDNPHALIILRTPTPGSRSKVVAPYVAAMKRVAARDASLLLIDQYSQWQKLSRTYPWLLEEPTDLGSGGTGVDQILMGNKLHPGYNGQLVMTRQFLKKLGLWTPDTDEANIVYETAISQEKTTSSLGNSLEISVPKNTSSSASGTHTAVTAATGGTATLSVDCSSLRDVTASTAEGKVFGETLGTITVSATSATTGVTRRATASAADAHIVITGLATGEKYTVAASSYATSRAAHVDFPRYAVETTSTWAAAHRKAVIAHNDAALKRQGENGDANSPGAAHTKIPAATVGASATMLWISQRAWKIVPLIVAVLAAGAIVMVLPGRAKKERTPDTHSPSERRIQ
jgi:lysophospholipase L1-like esterase